MRNYVKKLRDPYLAGISSLRLEYVQSILNGAESHERESQSVRLGTRCLVELSREAGPGAYITREELISKSGMESDSATAGLWVWLKNNADVVEEEPGTPRGSGAFRIRPEFYEAMQALFTHDPSPHRKRSILELEGLGIEIWEGIDAQEYVDRERRSWNG